MMRGIRRFLVRLASALGCPAMNSSLLAYDNAMVATKSVLAMPRGLSDINNLIGRFDLLVLRCAGLVALASFAAGAVMAMQFGAGMGRFGATNYIPSVVANSITQALGPMLAALMAAARSGGGLAAEIAGMVVTQQIDAIEALGSDPYRKLHAPNLFVLIVGLPLLTVVADIGGLFGGIVIEVTCLNLPFFLAVTKTIRAIVPLTSMLSIFKTAVAGALIGMIATREGIRANRGTSSIGTATTTAVIRATIAVLVADVFLTKLIWMVR